MQSTLPKQFLEIHGKPILVRTLERFYEFDNNLKIVLTLPEEHFDHWKTIKNNYFPAEDILLVKGGATRFDSVKNGLNSINTESGIVAIHDAVRPFVQVEIIKKTYDSARETGSGVVAVQLRDSIRKLDGAGSESMDRSKFRLMQTPQTFRLEMIRKAYLEADHNNFTDDAGVWEYAGHKVHLIEGSYQNIKITHPEDTYLAEAILRYQSDSSKAL